MTENKIIRDDLFIEMKYIILYRKLGYSEIKQDIFAYTYSDTTITIESEKQLFNFLGNQYHLKEYKDFVILECIDRLLKKGYLSTDILLNDVNYDMIITCNNQPIFKILAAGWDDYEKFISGYHHQSSESDEIVVLYTSQLSGGLVDYISKIYAKNKIFQAGIFEKEAKAYDFELIPISSSRNYPAEFVVHNDILKKYKGHDKIVRIPDGIKRIDTAVFWNMLFLEEIIIPESVTCIAGDTFIYCENLKKINIPQAVDEIGDNPFAGAENLVIENHSPHFVIDDEVLFDKNRKILIHYIPQNPRTTYIIPESVEWVGKHSFFNCKYLEQVTITKNVIFMGNNVFSDCPNIVLKNESPHFVYENGGLYNKAMTDFFHYSMGVNNKVFALAEGLRKIGRNSFWNCHKLEKLIIPASVREIGYNPFANCLNLEFENHSDKFSLEDGVLFDRDKKQLICCTSKVAQNGGGLVRLPSSLINIGRSAFTGCEGLTEVIIPEGVQQISRSAFSGCINLTKITIPKSVKRIEGWAFSDCLKLKQIQISKETTIVPTALNNCNAEVLYYQK